MELFKSSNPAELLLRLSILSQANSVERIKTLLGEATGTVSNEDIPTLANRALKAHPPFHERLWLVIVRKSPGPGAKRLLTGVYFPCSLRLHNPAEISRCTEMTLPGRANGVSMAIK